MDLSCACFLIFFSFFVFLNCFIEMIANDVSLDSAFHVLLADNTVDSISMRTNPLFCISFLFPLYIAVEIKGQSETWWNVGTWIAYDQCVMDMRIGFPIYAFELDRFGILS